MDALDAALERLGEAGTGSSSLLQVLMQMNDQNLVESNLDLKTWVLVRLAAQAAIGAPEMSYASLLAVTDTNEVTMQEMLGTLAAIAPTIGGPLVSQAAERLLAVTSD